MWTVVRRVALVVATLLVVTLALHLPMLYRAHGAHPRTGRCPFGYGGDHVAHVTVPPATQPSSLALGFVLGGTTTTDVERWAATRGLGCMAKHGGAAIECANVAAQLLPRSASSLFVTGVWFAFDDENKLVSVQVIRRSDSQGPVATAFTATNRGLNGPNVVVRESGSVDELGLGALRQASSEYRTGAFVSRIRATNMGNGYVLTESYGLHAPA